MNYGREHSARRAACGDGARGFTLLELMVVLVLVVFVVGSSVRGFKSLAHSDLRSAASHMSGAIRYLFDRASATGRVHRLVIDLDEGKYWAEITDDRFMMAGQKETDETRAREAEQIAKEKEEDRLKEEAKQSAFGNPPSASQYRPEEFRPKRAKFSQFKELALKPVIIKGPKIASIYTPRLADLLSTGRAYIYFFPLGQTEAALVHLCDKEGETFYTLVVHPLTGRVQIRDSYVKPDVVDQFDDEGNRITP